MKTIIIIMAMLPLAACSMETRHVDNEWGKAQMAAWDSMIVNPKPETASDPPTGIEGINAEGAMGVYNDSFWGQQKQTDVFTFGVTSGGSK